MNWETIWHEAVDGTRGLSVQEETPLEHWLVGKIMLYEKKLEKRNWKVVFICLFTFEMINIIKTLCVCTCLSD